MSSRLITALALMLLGIVAQAEELEFYPMGSDLERKLPFSEAVRAGELLFLSGMLGIKPGTGELIPGGIGPETRQTLEHIRAAVTRHGSSMDRVAKCTVFLADIAEWAAMNEVYVEFFPNNRPARSALGASGLALGARVEIECIAVLGD
jgi:2-iminobutanoate/2-iminopropanoate deaminase